MSTRILVPYDGSEPAADALTYAIETFTDPEPTAVYVLSVPEGYWAAFGDSEAFPRYDKARAHAEEVLAGAVEIGAERGVDVDTNVLTGAPHQRIVETAADEGFETIVVGSHGRGGLSRAVLGSVAEAVVRRATVPVVVVR